MKYLSEGLNPGEEKHSYVAMSQQEEMKLCI